MALRRSLCTPIPKIFWAAECLLEAVERHAEGDRTGAENLIKAADDELVRRYTDLAWGEGCATRYGFVSVVNPLPRYALKDRPKPRMPGKSTSQAILERDGYHCRFCGAPVIHPDVRRLMRLAYPNSLGWGRTNASQHAAFQCMWLQFDHLLPSSRGGDSSFGNVVITCAPCNFGRMEATLEEAQLINPLTLDPPVVWWGHAEWDGLESFRRQ